MGNTTSQYFSSGAATHMAPSAFIIEGSLDKVLWKRIEETATIARTAILYQKNVSAVHNILDGFSHITEVINLRDMNGFTLLQHAVVVNDLDIVRYLLQQGAEVNHPVCARPLHLAAKLARIDIVHLLLEFHADPDVLSCVCYPDDHFSSQMVCVPQMDHMHLACSGDVYSAKSVNKQHFEYPKYYAVVADSVAAVKIFEKSQHSSHDSNSLPDLHLACKLGSKDCTAYFLQQNKDAVNYLHSSGYTPIMHALKWDKALIELLVLNGALLTVKTKSKQTLLHLLLRQADLGLFDKLKYVLDCGMIMNVNAVDSAGNSALNVLLLTLEENRDQVVKTYKPGNVFSRHSRQVSWTAFAEMQPTPSALAAVHMHDLSDIEMQYVHCVDLLLKAGLNPNIANRIGNTSLHIVTRLLDGATGAPSSELVHVIDMRLIFALLTALVRAKGNVNLANNSDQSSIAQFVFCTIDDIFSVMSSPRHLPVIRHQVRYFNQCIRIMHAAGGQLSPATRGHSANRGCYLHSIFDVLDEFHKIGRISPLDAISDSDSYGDGSRDWAHQIVGLLREVVHCLLECGLNPNSCMDGSVMQKHFSLLYYKLMTSEPLVAVNDIESFLQLLIHHGVDVDRSGQHIMMTVLRPHMSSGYYRQLPCFPLLHLINMIGMHDHQQTRESELLHLLEFLFNAMSEPLAQQCVAVYLEYDRQMALAASANYKEFDTYLSMLVRTPRKLKQLVAKFVYRKLAHCTKANIQKLPLPVVLQNYIISFHY